MTNQELNTHAIKVIGHRNPDTDSICAAIAYSRLKNKLDPENPCKPCRAGLLNRETEFVLDYFQVPAPELYTDVSPQLRAHVGVQLGGRDLEVVQHKLRLPVEQPCPAGLAGVLRVQLIFQAAVSDGGADGVGIRIAVADHFNGMGIELLICHSLPHFSLRPLGPFYRLGSRPENCSHKWSRKESILIQLTPSIPCFRPARKGKVLFSTCPEADKPAVNPSAPSCFDRFRWSKLL